MFSCSHHNFRNIAELLVAKGLAKTVAHKTGEARSSCYDALCMAEKRYVYVVEVF